MGNHGVAGTKLRAGQVETRATKSTVFNIKNSRASIRDWPVSTRLLAVIVLALIMGLVFGGLRVSDAAGSAAQFGRVSQLASLGEQVTGLVQGLQDERDETTGVISGGNAATLKRWYNATDAAATRVRALAAGIGGSFPANIQAGAATVVSVINSLGSLRKTAQASQDALAVLADYATPISDMITLNDQIAQGTSDAILANDVRTLDSLSMAKDQAAQQRALLLNSFIQQFFGDGVQQALATALSEELTDKASFETTATPAEQGSFVRTVAGQKVNEAEGIEDFIVTDGNPADISQLGIGLNNAPAQWYSDMSDTVNKMQTVELGIAGNIVTRALALQGSARRSALFTGLLTLLVLLIVLVAAVLVARSLVLPLRRLRAGALNIATVQLPERVRQLGESTDPAASLAVAPIDVVSADEIGQVARAFDKVHAEAVRLAGNEAMLRNSFNAMFINLSRRSQLLIERLARMIDSQEQNEEDPDRLSNLFAMDHLVTRMRRNSENLLLLGGHESARKWSDPVPLADVARAATSEIEQYGRVSLSIQPGVAVAGQAVSDIVHLFAEIIENATMFSPEDSQVYVTARELASGGVLIEVTDSGVGVSESRLAQMNWRLDNPPVIDVSVSRHMGLFAVGRLAQRHGVRVRLRAMPSQGLTALVWLPDSVIEQGAHPLGMFPQRQSLAMASTADARPTADGRPGNGMLDNVGEPTRIGAGSPAPARAAAPATSNWFRNPPPAEPGAQPQVGDMSAGADGWGAADQQAAKIIANPARGEGTVAGLPLRVPKANLIPGSARGRHAEGRGSGHPSGPNEARMPAGPEPELSPETARSRLSGFQRGTRRAKGQPPGTGNGAGR
jgi:signal transduction histidine kinase